MSVRRQSLIAAACLLSAGYLGGTPEPVAAPYPEDAELEVTATDTTITVHWHGDHVLATDTCLVRAIGGRIAKQSGDTLWFRTLDRFEPATSPAPPSCATTGTAMIVAARDAIRVVHIVPVSVTRQVVGSALFAAAVGATILLIYSAADGLIDAVGRWF